MVTKKETTKKDSVETPKKAPKKAVHAGPLEFAVIATGGKQYVVSVGNTVKIEKMQGEHKEGDKVTFDKVLIVDDGKDTTIGNPYIQGALVSATLEEIGRSKKVEIIKYKQKSRYFVRQGHRQPYFLVRIESIK